MLGTYTARDLRPAAVCCTRAACIAFPAIIPRAPKVTAEVDAARTPAARAVTRVRRRATGDFATIGAEMVIAAICAMAKCGTKSGRSSAMKPLFGTVLDEFSRSVGFTFERENDGPARSITRQKLDQKRFSDRRLTLAFLGREKGSQIREVCFPGPLNFVVFSASASELLFSQRSAQLFADEWLVEIVPYVAR